MTKEFYYKGHHYKVVEIEGSEDFTIVKDGKFQRRVSKGIAANAMQNVDKLFKDWTMKVNELMIGDWVYIHEPECKGHRIDYINEMDEEVGADGELYSVNDIRPILLTEEILVHNGFEKFAESQTHFDFTDNDIYLEYWIGGGSFRYYTAEIHYVHQLQHLLRLCGIDKEIVIY